MTQVTIVPKGIGSHSHDSSQSVVEFFFHRSFLSDFITGGQTIKVFLT